MSLVDDTNISTEIKVRVIQILNDLSHLRLTITRFMLHYSLLRAMHSQSTLPKHVVPLLILYFN